MTSKELLPIAQLKKRMRALALSLPETHEDHPWGESAFKVRGKVFMFMSQHTREGESKGALHFTFKLPTSAHFALDVPDASPTGYGLGKSGWVSLKVPSKGKADLIMLSAWLRESYLAIAPKKISAALREGETQKKPKAKTKSPSRPNKAL